MAASKLRKVGQDFKRAGTPFDRWGAGESEVSTRGIKRRYVLVALDGVDTQEEACRRDATGTRSGSPCQDAVYYTAHLAYGAIGLIFATFEPLDFSSA